MFWEVLLSWEGESVGDEDNLRVAAPVRRKCRRENTLSHYSVPAVSLRGGCKTVGGKCGNGWSGEESDGGGGGSAALGCAEAAKPWAEGGRDPSHGGAWGAGGERVGCWPRTQSRPGLGRGSAK